MMIPQTARGVLLVAATLSLLIAGSPASAFEATPDQVESSTQRATAMQAGRIYTSTGVAWGGIVMMNSAFTTGVNLTTNTFNGNTDGSVRYKSEDPTISNTGRLAFASDRTGAWRIYTANADGSGVKQLTQGDQSVPADLHPSISPDGTKVAFLSRRPQVAGQPASDSVDIWLVSTNGRNLRRITTPETDSRASSYIRGVDWNDSGTRLVYRGTRLSPDPNDPAIREILGFINPNGTNETKLRIDDCGGGSMVDWVGSSVLYSRGGAVQGCYPSFYEIRDTKSGETTSLTQAQMGGASIGPGAARLSRDERYVLLTYSAPFYEATVVRIGVDGSARTARNTKAIAAGAWLWWTSDAFPRIGGYQVSPSTVRLKAGKSAQLTPQLRDKDKRIISASGADWTWTSPSPGLVITNGGRLTTSPSTPPGTYAAQITNAGRTASVTIIVR